MGTFFTAAALVTFGGAYAVLPLVTKQSINLGWMKPGQMVDGLALGETTPGPLIMVVTFVGFVGGWQAGNLGWLGAVLGCVIATYFTFLPSFIFIFMGAPFIEHMRDELRLTAALTGITAAVVGVVMNLAVFFGKTVCFPTLSASSLPKLFNPTVWWNESNPFAIALTAAAFLLLSRFKFGLPSVIGLCAAAGFLKFLLS